MKIIDLDDKTLPEPKEKGISRKQKAAIRYLTKGVMVKDPKTSQFTLEKPTIRMVCQKYGLKEETLLDWLVGDEDFHTEFLTIIKTDIIREMRALIEKAIKRGKETGDIKTIEFLIRFVEQGREKSSFDGNKSWEEVV